MTRVNNSTSTSDSPDDLLGRVALNEQSVRAHAGNEPRSIGRVICGGGPVGLTAACMLRLRGEQVTVLERATREQLVTTTPFAPSFNFTLVTRSVDFLRGMGIDVGDLVVEIDSRQFWHRRGVTIHPYGLRDTDRLYSIPRGQLMARLLHRAEALHANIRYGTRVASLDAKRGVILAESDGNSLPLLADKILVADGANSRLREDVARQADTSYVRQPDGFCYATVRIDPSAAGLAGLSLQRIHFVPGPNGIDIGLPNRDGSISLLLERRDPWANGHSGVEMHLTSLFHTGCPPILRRYVTDLDAQLELSPVRRFKYVQCGVWSFGRAVLLGDAARCCPPYTGQGLNGGIHDAASFAAALDKANGDWGRAAVLFELDRRAHAERVEKLTRFHGHVLHSGRFGDLQWRLCDRAQRIAERLFGFRSVYQQVVFDSVFPSDLAMAPNSGRERIREQYARLHQPLS